MRSSPFTRPTLIAAVELLEQHTQARFNQVVLRLGLENEISSSTNISVAKKCDLLGRIVVQHSDGLLDTLDGSMTLGEAVIRQAIQLVQPDLLHPQQTAFVRGLARDGYVLNWNDLGQDASLRAALPEEVLLPETGDEVHQLLKSFGFATPLGHLDQAIEAHTRGDWAACNGQLRTFLESLFDDIARRVWHEDVGQSAENRRALLAEAGFLSITRNEWTQDGKNYVNGLIKMLHSEGSHPGLSDEDHSTFRLHVVLVSARTFLRRLANGR